MALVCLGTPTIAVAPGSAGGVGTAHGGAAVAAAGSTGGPSAPRKRTPTLMSPTQMTPTRCRDAE